MIQILAIDTNGYMILGLKVGRSQRFCTTSQEPPFQIQLAKLRIMVMKSSAFQGSFFKYNDSEKSSKAR